MLSLTILFFSFYLVWNRNFQNIWSIHFQKPSVIALHSKNQNRLRLVVPGLGLGGLEWSLWWPPRTTSAQVHRGQVQVQLGFASLYLDLALVDLSGVGGGLPRATPAEVVQVKSRSNSASPRWTWTLPVRPQPGSVRSSSATVRLTLRFSHPAAYLG